MHKIISPRGRTRQAFTLIELLVVIAVIGILAAVLLPVLQGVTAKADETTCTGRLRQLGAALYLYSNDHNKTFPPTSNYYSGHQSVITALEPYTDKNATIFFCPRYLKDAPGRNAQAIYNGGEFGYYYWAFDTADATHPLSDSLDTSAWSVQGYATPPGGKVLLSDIFGDHQYWGGPDDVQMHAGSTRYLALQKVGTQVFIAGGSVQKIAPEKPTQ